MPDLKTRPVVLGQINGVFGVKGWVKVFDYSRERGGILDYPRWMVGQGDSWKEVALIAGKRHGKGVIARLDQCSDRDQALSLVGSEVAVKPEWLSPTDDGEFYWFQLEGLAVFNLEGECLGNVDHLLETGANDVLVVKSKKDRLIPYVRERVHEVDLEKGRIIVDWDAAF